MTSRAGPDGGGGGSSRGPPLPAPRGHAAAADQRAVEQWLRFALAQEERIAPHPDPASLPTCGSRAAYRLALRHLDGLPLFASEDRCFDVRLGVSLWYATAGCFFGNTAHSAPVSYDMRRSKGKRGFHLNLDFSLYLHTRAALLRHSTGSSSGGSSTCTGTGAVGSGGAAAAVGGSGGLAVNSGGCGLAAVVEVVLVERGEDGVTLNEFSAGWSMLPLGGSGGSGGGSGSPNPHAAAGPAVIAPDSPSKAGLSISASNRRNGNGSRGALRLGSCLGCSAAPSSPALAHEPLSPLQAGALAARLGTGGSLSVPVFVGSPRWLVLHRASPPGKCPAPPQLLADGAECRLHFQFEPCPDAEAWAPLVPDNFLLSSQDVVPGVQRWPAGAGSSASVTAPAPTLAFLNTASQLEPPQLCAMHAVVLSGLRLHLPDGFVEVARQHAAAVWRHAHAGGSGTAASPVAAGGGRLLPLSDLQHRLRLRVAVHNGRRFVGPPAVCQVAALEPAQGQRGEHELLLSQSAQLAWLPGDRHVMLVLELLLHTDPPPSSRGGPAGGSAVPNAADSELADAPGTTVLGWTAVAPFTWQAGSLQPAVASGQHQAALRSGPGRWLRPSPVLDWRRLLECTNRLSPEAPTITFRLAEAPGQALWPPPSTPVPLQAALSATQPPVGSTEQHAQLSPAPSEAETLVSVKADPASQKPAPPPAAVGLAALAGGKPIAVLDAVQAWHISARYDAADNGTREQQAQQAQQAQQQAVPSLPLLPSIRTRPPPAERLSGLDAAALYAGSPTKARGPHAGQLGGGSSATRAPMGASEAAAAALPAAALERRHVSLAAELDDPLVSAEATLQFIAFEAQPSQGCTRGCSSHSSQAAQQPLPLQVHFTYRSLAGPAVTAPLQLQPAAHSPGPTARQLFALVADESGPNTEAVGSAPTAAPVHRLQLLDTAGLLQLVSAEGLPPAAAASLARQHRLRAARWLAQGRLQVDVWDSASLLQVGTFSLPLHGLLRQGQPSTELLLRVPVGDPQQAISRLDPSGSPSQLCCSPICGSFIVRLACAGSQLDLPAACSSHEQADSCSWPASPLKQGRQQGASDGTVVLQARPALEEGGQVALELARQEGVPDGTAPDRLAHEVVSRAAAKVQRLLHYRSLPGAARRRQSHGSSAAAAAVSSANGPEAAASAAGTSEAVLLLERRLLSEVEAARERCKREAILARLQAELPSCQALCIAPGEQVGFECEFINSSSSPRWFEVDLGASGSSTSGDSPAATISLVFGQDEWGTLEQASELTGLVRCASSLSPSGSQARGVYSPRFQLAAHERCLLRLKLSSSLGGDQAAESSTGSTVSWHDIVIRQAGSSTEQPATGAAAVMRVCVQQLAAPAVSRTLRLYCPALSSGLGSSAAVVHVVDLSQLAGSECLLTPGQLTAFASSSRTVRAALDGSKLMLSCAAAKAGTTQRCFVAAYTSGQGGRSSSGGSPAEVWEVFVHSLPTLRLAAGVGAGATASCFISHAAAASRGTSTQQLGLACSWRGCSSAELAASLGSGPSTAAAAGPGGSSRLVLSFEPVAVVRCELLLSVIAGRGTGPGIAAAQGGGQQGFQLVAAERPQQVELLLLVQLDSSGTRFSRTFEVEVHGGQSVSKKVRYSSPHPQPRRFAVRSLQPELLRPAHKWQRAAGGVLLQPGEEASIRMSFEGAAAGGAAAAAAGSSGTDGRAIELLAVLESAAAAPLGSAAWQVEEVFRVLLTVV